MQKRCLHCGKPFEAKRQRGRPKVYCSRKHKDEAYRARVRHLLAKARG